MRYSKFDNNQVKEISNFLQIYMVENDINSMTADECSDLLAKNDILEQIPPKPAFNFRQMLRDGRDGLIDMVEGATQELNNRWKVSPIVRMKVNFENCSYENEFLFEEDALSTISVVFEAKHFPTKQSKKEKIRVLKRTISAKLNKIEWLIYGDVNLDFAWYFSAINKKETNTDGDLDNLAKVIIDSFVGNTGLFIDDSQMGSLSSIWLSRNEDITDTVLKMQIRFNNEYCIKKEKLKFVQLDKSIYMVCDFEETDIESLFRAKILLHILKKKRLNMLWLYDKLPNAAYSFISDVLFHKSRLNAVDTSLIIEKAQFNLICQNAGLTYEILLRKAKPLLS